MAKKVPEGYELVPPDGGWGWAVVFGTVLVGMVISIPLNAIGLMFSDIILQLHSTASTASWIPALTVSMAQFAAPFNALIIKSSSCRIALLLGGFSCSLGLILSYFANSIEALFITFGVFVGAGLGMCTNASFIVLSQYFRKYYGVATGITMSSYASGKLVFSPLIQLMLEAYGFRGVFLIMGGLTLNVFVGAALCQPVKWHYILVRIQKDEEAETNETKASANDNHVSENGNSVKNDISDEMKDFAKVDTKVTEVDPEVTSSLLKKRHPQEEKLRNEMPEVNFASSWDVCNVESVTPREIHSTTKDKGNGCAEWCKNGPMKTLNFSQLKRPVFYILLASGVLGFISAVYVGVYSPPFAAQMGIDGLSIAAMSSFRSVAEMVGRLVTPWIQERFKIHLLFLYCGLSLVQGVGLLVFVFTRTFGWMTAISVFIGIFYGGASSLSILVMVDCVGVSELGAMLGLTQFMQGFFSLGIGPFMGFLVDAVGSYDVCFYFLAVSQFLVCIIWAVKYWALPYKVKPAPTSSK